jgi:pimeloyl-ACP methyl ester carboxylesterase
MLRTKRKIVITLHGIRTRGLWQKELAPLIGEQGWIYWPFDYGWFSLLSFVPSVFRTGKIDWFRKRYAEVSSRYPDVIPSIIAHSFGTWIVTKAIERYEHLRFDKVILTGSIAPRNCNWKQVYERNQIAAVRNDIGRRDVWARFSRFFAWGTGSAGFHGFNQKAPFIFQRIYDYGHSSAFGYDHYLGEWIPFIARPLAFSDGQVPSEAEDSVSPYDAARWSAITYFKQYICRICDALVRGEVYDDSGAPMQTKGRLIVLVPTTPGQAAVTPTGRYYKQHGLHRVILGGPTRRTCQIGNDGVLYDIPTTIHSLLCLDHRTDDELVDAVNEFAKTLQERIDAADSEAKEVAEIRRI